ncbi:hypothetical protein HOY81_25370 [Streptomyces sp. JJ36]|nr:hypothetical protein [Streptomyces sp. JJ36]
MPDNHGSTPKGSRRTGWAVVLSLFVLWTVLANQWVEQGCEVGESYGLVLSHGTPDLLEALVLC